MTPSTPVDSALARGTVCLVSIGLRQLPALAALTILLAAGTSALGTTGVVEPVATGTNDVDDGVAIPQRPSLGLTKVVLRMPAPVGMGAWHRPLATYPALAATQLAHTAEQGSAAPLYDLLRVYRL